MPYKNPEIRRQKSMERLAKWKKEHPEYKPLKRGYSGYNKTAVMKYRTGLTPKEFQELFNAQGGLCALCKKPMVLGEDFLDGLSPVIDHDHSRKCCKGNRCCEKCRRGIIHRKCNTGIGMFDDNPVSLRLAAEYLEKYRVD